ncbi:fluoride efflux transporter CrcB [Alicyclobacillus mengziensis]|uniref:Fluoride-specific ion channel FluC n=1 Tax=Alicyclobacillus mengziensis TaxID=2931921 RepID=A0A9X7Z4N2_9BACL|nr:fluoride efflux transporter CrcB [Alicyclobacillus mengziensis]QSO46144.1 fluoride efflux transporter CrcB [Alicyclobacillus mengziensis]
MGLLFVGIGGSIGAVCRFLVGRWVTARYPSSFPLGTFAVNVTGALVLGLVTRLAGLLLPHMATAVSLFLGIGFCGAYTTFSTFSYETVTLIRQHRVTTAALYVGMTFIVGFAAAGFGLYGLSTQR